MSANIVGPLYWYEATLFYILSVIRHDDGFRERRALEWLIPIGIIIFFILSLSGTRTLKSRVLGAFSFVGFSHPQASSSNVTFFGSSARVRDCLLVVDSSAVFTFWRQTAGRSYHQRLLDPLVYKFRTGCYILRTQITYLGSVRSAFSDQYSQISILRSALSDQHSQISTPQISTLRSALSDQHSQISTLRSALSDQHSQISTLRSAFSDQHSQISILRSAFSDQHSQISTLRSASSDQHSQISTLRSAFSDQYSQISISQISIVGSAFSVQHSQTKIECYFFALRYQNWLPLINTLRSRIKCYISHTQIIELSTIKFELPDLPGRLSHTDLPRRLPWDSVRIRGWLSRFL